MVHKTNLEAHLEPCLPPTLKVNLLEYSVYSNPIASVGTAVAKTTVPTYTLTVTP